MDIQLDCDHSTDDKIVLVSKFPINTSAEALTIHFQKRRNGGGEVESVRLIGEGLALVEFEDKKVADSILARTHTINGKEAKVELYRPSKMQIFDRATAQLNVDLQLKLRGSLSSVLEQVRKETEIDWHQAAGGFLVSGTFEQLTKVRTKIKKFLQEDQKNKNMTSGCSLKESTSSSGISIERKTSLGRKRKQSVNLEVEAMKTPNYSSKKRQPSLCKADKNDQHRVKSDTRENNAASFPSQTGNTTERKQPVVKDSMAGNKAVLLACTDLASDNSDTSSGKGNKKTKAAKEDTSSGVEDTEDLASDNSYTSSGRGNKKAKAVKEDTSSGGEDTENVSQEEYTISSGMARFLLHFHSDLFSTLEKYVDVQTKEGDDNFKLILTNKPGCQKEFGAKCKSFSSFYQTFKQNFYQKEIILDKQSSGEVLQSIVKNVQSHLPVLIDAGKDMTSLTIYGSYDDVMCAVEKIQLTFQNKMVEDSQTCHEENKLELTTNTGIRLSVTKGDITMETVDVIVNAANEKLIHGGGVARAIVDKGGRSIQEESSQVIRLNGRIKPGMVAWTSAGTLPCKGIIHAVGPIWKPEKGAQCKKILGTAVTESLLMASGFRMKSIAFPPISAGIFGMPATISAKVLLDASLKFANNVHPTYEGINDIRFVIIDDPTFSVFKDEFIARFSKRDNCCTKKELDSKDIFGKENGSAASNIRKDPQEQQKGKLIKDKHTETKVTLGQFNKKNGLICSSVEAEEHEDSVQSVPRSVDDVQPREINGTSVSNNMNSKTEQGMVEESNLVVSDGDLDIEFEETPDPVLSQLKFTSKDLSPKPNIKCESRSDDRVDELLSSSFEKLTISTDRDEKTKVISFKEGNGTHWKKEEDEKSAEIDDKNVESEMSVKIGDCFVCHTEIHQADPLPNKFCKIHHSCDDCLLKFLSLCNRCPVCHDVYGIFKNKITSSVNQDGVSQENCSPSSREQGKSFAVDAEKTGFLEASKQQNLVPNGLNKYALPDGIMVDSQCSQDECAAFDSNSYPTQPTGHMTCSQNESDALDLNAYPTQPTGHMTWKKYSKRLPGYESTAIIAVTFAFYDGVQEEHHPRPGQPYKGTKLVVCLPSTAEGVNVLKLFQTAFDSRLLFTVRSSSEGDYEVNWSLVKPKLCKLNSKSTREAFPDSQCLERLQQELTSKLKEM